MKIKCTLFILLASLFFIPSVYAGNEIIDYLSQEIYDDCYNKDIDIPEEIGFSVSDQKITHIDGPVNLDTVKFLVRTFVTFEPFSLKLGGGGPDKVSGYVKLLSCEDYELRANLYTYYWKGERIDPFIYNYDQTVTEVFNMIQNAPGAYKPAMSQCAGENCTSEASNTSWFSDNVLIISVILSLTISIAIGISIYFIIKKKLIKK